MRTSISFKSSFSSFLNTKAEFATSSANNNTSINAAVSCSINSLLELGSVDEMFKRDCDVAVSAAVSGVSAIAPNYHPQIMVFTPS